MNYDKDTIYAILDEARICTVSYVKDGEPRAIPTGYVRIGDYIYIHGSVKSHFFRQIEKSDTVCITTVILDGFVLAKSDFNHSFNYRSVVLFGIPEAVTSRVKKKELLYWFTERYIPGRWEKTRKPTSHELNATAVIKFQIVDASAKIRDGMPNDLEKDKNWPVWSGIVPLKMQIMEPIPDENNTPGVDTPEYLQNL